MLRSKLAALALTILCVVGEIAPQTSEAWRKFEFLRRQAAQFNIPPYVLQMEQPGGKVIYATRVLYAIGKESWMWFTGDLRVTLTKDTAAQEGAPRLTDVAWDIRSITHLTGFVAREVPNGALSSPLSVEVPAIVYATIPLREAGHPPEVWTLVSVATVSRFNLKRLLADVGAYLVLLHLQHLLGKEETPLEVDVGGKKISTPMSVHPLQWKILSQLPFEVGIFLYWHNLHKHPHQKVVLAELIEALSGTGGIDVTIGFRDGDITIFYEWWRELASKPFDDAMKSIVRLVLEQKYSASPVQSRQGVPPSPPSPPAGGNLSTSFSSTTSGGYTQLPSLFSVWAQIYPANPLALVLSPDRRCVEGVAGLNTMALRQWLGDPTVYYETAGTQAVWRVGGPYYARNYYQTWDIDGRPMWVTTPFPTMLEVLSANLINTMFGGQDTTVSYVPPHLNPYIQREMMWYNWLFYEHSLLNPNPYMAQIDAWVDKFYMKMTPEPLKVLWLPITGRRIMEQWTRLVSTMRGLR